MQIYLEALDLDRNMTETHINIANVYYLLDEYDKAINHYIQAIRKNDDKKSEAYYNLGNALCVKKHYKDAIKCFKKVIKYDSSNVEAMFNLGNCFFAMGIYNKAIAKYEVCQKLGMDTKEVKVSLTKSYIELADKDSLYKAESLLRSMLVFEEKDPELNMVLGICKEKCGSKSEALQYFKVKINIHFLFFQKIFFLLIFFAFKLNML